MFLVQNNSMMHMNISVGGRMAPQAPPMLQQALPVFQQFATGIAAKQLEHPAFQRNTPNYATLPISNKKPPQPLVRVEIVRIRMITVLKIIICFADQTAQSQR
jgi:hypothetical protein